MAKKSSIVVKPGDDISWAGTISRAGIESFAGYSLKAQFRAKGNCSEAPQSLLATSTITWVDVASGTFLLKVPRATTGKWPAGITVLLDIQVVDPDDKRVRTESIEFKTEAGVTVLGGTGEEVPPVEACECSEWLLIGETDYPFYITGASGGVTLGINTIVINPPESDGQASATIVFPPNAILRLTLSGNFSMYQQATIGTANGVATIDGYSPPSVLTQVCGEDGLLQVFHPGVSLSEDHVEITLTVEILKVSFAA